MLTGIQKPNRGSSQAADHQPLLPKGPDQSKGSTSSHGHTVLAGRGSPGPAPGTGSMAPRRPFLARSEALSTDARADAQAAFPGQRLRFAADVSVVQSGVKIGQKAVEFGDKAKPARLSAQRPPEPVAPPAPEQPKPTERHRFFGGMFGSNSHKTDKPASSSSSRPAESSAAVPPHERTGQSPAEKFSKRLADFMTHCPDKELKTALMKHLPLGNFPGFKQELIEALKAHRGGDDASYKLMQLMLSSLNKMKEDDYTKINILVRHPGR